ncbi:hypothetical protein C8233_04425 [Halomonas sp. SF2003]|nr:hypothetical protein C8233_04425 [Halomonas sp. SF2003]
MRVIIFICIMAMSISMANAKVYFDNPNEDNIQNEVEALDFDVLKEAGSTIKPVESYLLGLLYAQGYAKQDIEVDKTKSAKFMNQAWEGNVADAGYALAQFYYNGIGVHKNIEKAKYFLIESATQGYSKSQTSLGIAYWGKSITFPNIVDKDLDKAEHWLLKVAERGYGQSASSLSKFYLSQGQEDKSFLWAKRSVDAKFKGVQMINLGDLAPFYEKGIGTTKDLVLAYKYYDLLGTAGVKEKNRIAKDMTDAEIAEAIQQSRAWQEEHNIFVPSYNGLQHQSDGSYR